MTVTVARAGEDDREGWQAYVDGHPDAHFAHRWEWRGILGAAFGQQSHYLIARHGGSEKGGIAGILPLVHVKSFLFGSALISVPYLNAGGILADDEDTARAIRDRALALVAEMAVGYLEMRHRGPVPALDGALTARSHKVAMTLPLPADSDDLLQSFKSKFRNKVRRSSQKGFDAISVPGNEADAATMDAFYRVFCRHMRDLGTPIYPKVLFQAAVRAFGPRCRVILVRLEGRPVAAGITIGEGNRVEIPWASALQSVKDFRHNMLLYWQGMVSGCEDGYSVFDFGRSTPGSGPHRFKTQWGGETLPLHWYYAKGTGDIPNVDPGNPRFAVLVEGWKRLPVPLANVLGPFLTRSIP